MQLFITLWDKKYGRAGTDPYQIFSGSESLPYGLNVLAPSTTLDMVLGGPLGEFSVITSPTENQYVRCLIFSHMGIYNIHCDDFDGANCSETFDDLGFMGVCTPPS
jgi:hypothetical protein